MQKTAVSDEVRYKLLNLIQDNPNISQRELAEKMGVSVGKVNYCIKSLVNAGSVKLQNFARSSDRSGYVYLLTPEGVRDKLQVARRFLAYKQSQYDLIQKEIKDLRRELSQSLE